MFLLRLLVCVSVVLLSGCGGLDPTEIPTFTGIRGTITYEGGSSAWPVPDSVIEVRVVAFDERPTDASQILGALLAGKAAVTDTLSRFVDQSSYTLEINNAPRTFNYVVVALRYGPDFQLHWRMLDVYSITDDPSQPSSLTVNQLEDKRVDFHVNFSQLPPQPF